MMRATVEPCPPPVMPGRHRGSVMVRSDSPVCPRTKKRPWLEPTGSAVVRAWMVPKHVVLPAGSATSCVTVSSPHASGSLQLAVTASENRDVTFGAGSKRWYVSEPVSCDVMQMDSRHSLS